MQQREIVVAPFVRCSAFGDCIAKKIEFPQSTHILYWQLRIISQVSSLKNITYYGIKAVRESTFSINKNISVFVCSKYRGRTFGNITNITRSGSCIMKNYLCTHCKRSNTSHSFTNAILLLIYYHV